MKTDEKSKNIIWHEHKVTREQREKLLNQRGCVVWFTGLSGCGKSTIANELSYRLYKKNKLSYIFDGDNIRHGLNKDLGFSAEDRSENIRRISEIARLFADAGVITITAFISPYRKDRHLCRDMVGKVRFIEVYVKASLSVCEKRDPKGLYKKARAGDIKDFTGIDAPYEEPENPEVVVDTEKESVKESTDKIIEKLVELEII